ncbi:hypothetical protein VNI00_004543 [Paramarasmius palmivorus]|uniref:F-box domain-containing protein n=1 Tax=Paramarasmius palmivorus TaxID=297713 RepID=A0AAW0DKI1_9AGAR
MVCRHWRLISLKLHAMWNTPDFELPHLARVMLHRSRDAPLNIVISWLPSEDQELKSVLSEAMNQRNRLARLFLNLDAAPVVQEVVSMCVGPVPILRSVHLQHDHLHGTSPFMLPKGFLGGEAPRLSTLSLHNCLLSENWESPLLHERITKLVWNVSSTTTLLHCQRAFFQTLARMPYLEILELDHVLPSSITNPPVVFLPHLRRLRLASTGSVSFDALHYITFSTHNPPCIHLGCDTNSVIDYSYGEVKHLLEIAIRSVSPKSLEALSISGNPTNTVGNIVVRAWDVVPADIETLDPTSQADLTVEFSWHNEHPSACFVTSRRVIDATLCILSSSIETLRIGDAFKDEHFPLMACARFCGPTLKYLILVGSAAWQIPRTLTIRRKGRELPYSFSHDSSGQLAFSALSILTFIHVNFGTPDNGLMRWLQNSFLERSQGDCSTIEKVRIIGCTQLSNSVVDILGHFTREVELISLR